LDYYFAKRTKSREVPGLSTSNLIVFPLRSGLDGRQVFTGFLRSEFTEENMEFLNACQEFKRASPEKMAAEAQLLFARYVEADAPKQVAGCGVVIFLSACVCELKILTTAGCVQI